MEIRKYLLLPEGFPMKTRGGHTMCKDELCQSRSTKHLGSCEQFLRDGRNPWCRSLSSLQASGSVCTVALFTAKLNLKETSTWMRLHPLLHCRESEGTCGWRLKGLGSWVTSWQTRTPYSCKWKQQCQHIFLFLHHMEATEMRPGSSG